MDKVNNERIEYRQAIDGNFYTRNEFYEYYGGYVEWGFNHPLNIQRREVIMRVMEGETDLDIIRLMIDKLVSI